MSVVDIALSATELSVFDVGKDFAVIVIGAKPRRGVLRLV